MDKAISVLLFAVFVVVSCENGTTTLAPRVVPWNETGVCRKCSCKDAKVNCFDQSLTKFFSKEDWANLKEFKPTSIDLSDNLITNVTAMAELPVKVLNLSRCSISFIENASFKDLQKMDTLDLSHNKLTSDKLSPHAFEGRYLPEEYEPLASMRKLNLAYNDLHSLHQDLFEHLPELTELDLSGNPLTTIDHVTLIAISSLPKLKVLRMRSCKLTEIPDKFLHTPRYLERLDLSDNKLISVPQELEETKNLKYLNLNQNPIVKLDMSSEKYPGFPRLRKLEELHMCNMRSLVSIGAGALSGLENLQKLHMSFNPKLEYIDPKALARPDDIGETYDWPLIKEFCSPPSSCCLAALLYLRSGMEDKMLEPYFHGLGKSSKSASVRGTLLLSADMLPVLLVAYLEMDTLHKLSGATQLYLQSNNLSEVDSRFLSRWDLVEILNITDNPYMCDCTTQWMVDVLVPLVEAKVVNASEKLVCAEPIEMKGYTMKHLHDIHRTMRCLDKYGNHPERDGAMLLGTLIGVLLAVPIVFVILLLWRRGYLGWLGMRPNETSRAFYKRAPHDDNYI